jgi:hypothetical protein
MPRIRKPTEQRARTMLLSLPAADMLIADKSCDSDWFRER